MDKGNCYYDVIDEWQPTPGKIRRHSIVGNLDFGTPAFDHGLANRSPDVMVIYGASHHECNFWKDVVKHGNLSNALSVKFEDGIVKVLYPINASTHEESLSARFERLFQQWSEEIQYLSAPEDIFSKQPYQEILRMKQAALPYIFEKLKIGSGNWFHALTNITGINPITREMRNNPMAMNSVWLKWAESNGYLASESTD